MKAVFELDKILEVDTRKIETEGEKFALEQQL